MSDPQETYAVIEQRISDAAQISAAGDPRIALDKLRQTSIMLFRAQLEMDERVRQVEMDERIMQVLLMRRPRR